MKFLLRCCLAACTLAGCRSGHPDCTLGKHLDLDGVGHVVIFWLKEPGDAEDRQRIISASKSFITIDGVIAVRAGTSIPSPRRNVDNSFDVAVLMWFRDREALESYQSHPKHKAMLQEVGPLVERVTVYDFASVYK